MLILSAFLFVFSRPAPNRHCLLCPFCLKTQDNLSVHLRRVCLKDGTEAAILACVQKARLEILELLKEGRIFSYSLLTAIISDANPIQRLVTFTLLSV